MVAIRPGWPLLSLPTIRHVFRRADAAPEAKLGPDQIKEILDRISRLRTEWLRAVEAQLTCKDPNGNDAAPAESLLSPYRVDFAFPFFLA